MIDHVFLTVSDLKRSIAFYEAALAPLGITQRFDYDGKNGPPDQHPTNEDLSVGPPPGHPDLYGFGANGRLYLWLRQGTASGPAAHVGFVASSREQVRAAYSAAMAAGASDNGAPGIRAYYDPRYYAANVFDPDGYSLEFVYKSWQHE